MTKATVIVFEQYGMNRRQKKLCQQAEGSTALWT